MLHIVTEGQFGSRFAEDRSRGIIVVRSDLPLKNGSFNDAWAELDSAEARHRALGFANQMGVADARINGMASAPYAVNAEGLPLEQVRDEKGSALPLTHPRMRIDHYRVDLPVTRRLV